MTFYKYLRNIIYLNLCVLEDDDSLSTKEYRYIVHNAGFGKFAELDTNTNFKNNVFFANLKNIALKASGYEKHLLSLTKTFSESSYLNFLTDIKNEITSTQTYTNNSDINFIEKSTSNITDDFTTFHSNFKSINNENIGNIYMHVSVLEYLFQKMLNLYTDKENFFQSTYIQSILDFFLTVTDNTNTNKFGVYYPFANKWIKYTDVLNMNNISHCSTDNTVNIDNLNTIESLFKNVKNHMILTNKIFEYSTSTNSGTRKKYNYFDFKVYLEAVLLFYRTIKIYLHSCFVRNLISDIYDTASSNISNVSYNPPTNGIIIADELKKYFFDITQNNLSSFNRNTSSINIYSNYDKLYLSSERIKFVDAFKTTIPENILISVNDYFVKCNTVAETLINHYKNRYSFEFLKIRKDIQGIQHSINGNNLTIHVLKKILDLFDFNLSKEIYLSFGITMICAIFSIVYVLNEDKPHILFGIIVAMIFVYIIWYFLEYYLISINESFVDCNINQTQKFTPTEDSTTDIDIYNKTNIIQMIKNGNNLLGSLRNNSYYNSIVIGDMKKEKTLYQNEYLKQNIRKNTIDYKITEVGLSLYQYKNLTEMILRIVIILFISYFIYKQLNDLIYLILIIALVLLTVVFAIYLYNINRYARTDFSKRMWISNK